MSDEPKPKLRPGPKRGGRYPKDIEALAKIADLHLSGVKVQTATKIAVGDHPSDIRRLVRSFAESREELMQAAEQRVNARSQPRADRFVRVGMEQVTAAIAAANKRDVTRAGYEALCRPAMAMSNVAQRMAKIERSTWFAHTQTSEIERLIAEACRQLSAQQRLLREVERPTGLVSIHRSVATQSKGE